MCSVECGVYFITTWSFDQAQPLISASHQENWEYFWSNFFFDACIPQFTWLYENHDCKWQVQLKMLKKTFMALKRKRKKDTSDNQHEKDSDGGRVDLGIKITNKTTVTMMRMMMIMMVMMVMVMMMTTTIGIWWVYGNPGGGIEAAEAQGGFQNDPLQYFYLCWLILLLRVVLLLLLLLQGGFQNDPTSLLFLLLIALQITNAQNITLFGLTVTQCRVVWGGDWGSLGRVIWVILGSLPRCSHCQCAQPWTEKPGGSLKRVRWVSKFNFFEMVYGFAFLDTTYFRDQMAMFDVVRVAQQIKRKQGICSEICSVVKLLLRRTSARIIWSIWHVHTGACILSPFRSCLAFGISILCALRATSFVQ